jgi:hypothetical protein
LSVEFGSIHPWRVVATAVLVSCAAIASHAQAPSAVGGIHPNTRALIERPLRYQPQGDAFVIHNGAERFNRPLYGGNTAFRVDGGDKPEFVLYLPGRGGNLRLALRARGVTRWLHSAADITTGYRPGELFYEIRDPLLGEAGLLRITALAYRATEGLTLQVTPERVASRVELLWAFGGVNGERGKRDGDIGTESVPISEWFQPKPEFAADNRIEISKAGRFSVVAKPATLAGVVSPWGRMSLSDAEHWSQIDQLFAPLEHDAVTAPSKPLVVGALPLTKGPAYLSIQRLASDVDTTKELDVYSAVTAERKDAHAPAARAQLAAEFTAASLPSRFEATRQQFAALRARVVIDTPDPFLNAAVGALNVAADAVWDEPQQAIMHGAIAWRAKLLGWRGPYALDALGWHDRARANFEYWFGRQNTDPIPEQLPPADESSNLARNEAGLHSNGDMANAHYDMNAVFIDALFRHLAWTGDIEFARRAWPVIERHLAWEKRLFRRQFAEHADKRDLPLYEAYAQIWASDDLQYSGGGVAYASAYNLYHNRMAAKLAKLLGHDASSYEAEAEAIGNAMRHYLWQKNQGTFAEYKDLLGLQLVHPSAGLWTFYHTMDSGVPTPREAWSMASAVERLNPRLPVMGPGVPVDQQYEMFSTTNWMPYSWSINNVVMGENLHTALGFWQAGRVDAAYRLAKSSLLASMYMGISPGNVGSMNHIDVYRREAQRDFADGSGVMARAIVEGLFGINPDALSGVLELRSGLPPRWQRASLTHPNLELAFERNGAVDRWTVTQLEAHRFNSLKLRVPATHEKVASVRVNGQRAEWRADPESVGRPLLEVRTPLNTNKPTVVQIEWAGAELQLKDVPGNRFAQTTQGEFTWWQPSLDAPVSSEPSPTTAYQRSAQMQFQPINLDAMFNDRVTEIFRPGKYRTPRSPYVSLALPAQGIGAWAGHVNAMAEIDDSGLRRLAAASNNQLVLPDGVVFRTPGQPGAANVIFTSQWDNYPRQAAIPLCGRARHAHLLMAGSTNHMQSRLDNGEIVIAYSDGTATRFPLRNPSTWWPIDQDYLTDDYQFPLQATRPTRIELQSGRVRPASSEQTAAGGSIAGGAATVLDFPLEPHRTLKSLTVRALANDVVIGLMAVTLARDDRSKVCMPRDAL